MKKVVLLGDSIRMGYGPAVAQLLGNEFTVWQPDDNCRYAQYTYQHLSDDEWDGLATNTKDVDIIHWNNGLWDVNHWFEDGPMTPKEFYVDTMVRIAKLLLQRSKIVIFATTTPVRETHPTILNTEVIDYNQALVPELKKLGVVINDLHTLIAADIPRYILASDHIHLTEDGVSLCSKQVADVIRQQAENL